MAAPRKLEKFCFPQDLQYIGTRGQGHSASSQKVCVVAVVGKTGLNAHTGKATPLNQVFDKQIFQSLAQQDLNIDTEMCTIEGHLDESQQVLFLHLLSGYDTYILADMCEKASDTLNTKGYNTFWQQEDHQHARALLFLFSVSHIIMLVNAGQSFDVSYVRLFRTLDSIRQKLLPSVTDILKAFPVSKDWMMSGRLCSPRVLFVFDKCTIAEERGEDRSRGQEIASIKKLQHAIEDQIYRVLRKSRVITNISNNSLFAVPANQEFVFVQTPHGVMEDPASFYMNLLKDNCTVTRDSESPRTRSYQMLRRCNMNNNSSAANNSSSTSAVSHRSSSSGSHSFKEFLTQHIELALTKGFNDNVGRNPVPALFELPTINMWLRVASKLYEFFTIDQKDTKVRPHFNTLKSLLEIDTRFSDGRCSKVIPVAETTYQEGLPKHYTRAVHLAKLSQAKRVFAQHARGPAFDKYLQQLEEECEKIWKNGRQLCEHVSLTGSPCIHELHRLPSSEETPENGHLPVKSHSSQVKTRAACNCGQKQGDRDDPFDQKSANYTFYQNLERQCCEKLQHHHFPAYHAAPQEDATAQASAEDVPRQDNPSLEPVIAALGNLSLPHSSEQSLEVDDLFPTGERLSQQPSQPQPPLLEGNSTSQQVPEDPAIVEIGTVSSVKTSDREGLTEKLNADFLTGMLHSCSPPGVLPKYPAWSLVCLATYSSYSPVTGIDQPGFMHGSNYLLPWDILVKGDREKWPAINEAPGGKKGKNKRGQKSIPEPAEINMKVYLGLEYECPRGHRFFCSGPEKIIKVPGSGPPKDNANKLLSNDMPLYFPCHCRSSKGLMAQLMRIYIATPEGPTNISINPRIQPAPLPCPVFMPSHDGAIVLPQGGIWVLRLPYVYMGDHGPYRIPTEANNLPACRLLKGMFAYTHGE
ncbi:protein SMG8 [Lingula anatina]|uniref:Nonsense-mediated mRNA decay factor SMG8 n=1 Tax=Lingula anatina TaxID=7574 RepID=A0A1S3IK96_LINAN|nr:protein SMG8 [Lingula anatina]|eukprot:XP_013398523.1 protein SMG8 [Lingula anatina]